MAVPSYDRFIEPLLRYLAGRPEGVRTGDTYESLAKQFGLGEGDREQLLPSGSQSVYQNRIGWAHDRLKRAGLSTSPRRGFWVMTPKGSSYISAHPQPFSQQELSDIWRVARISVGNGSEPTQHVAPDVPVLPQGPEELIADALEDLRESVVHDLLDRISRMHPTAFERLVLELLHAMGYGTSRDDLQHVGRSGDGGIDGVISLDRLGLERVYVQAKRWQASISSEQVRGFMGALQLQGASKGVFMTTSSFTKDAREASSRARGSIVLIDGARLATLLVDHGVAVSHKTLRIPKVDGDYFEDA